jgi:hypothetical protein
VEFLVTFSVDQLRQAVLASAALFPLDVVAAGVRFVALTEQDYRAASFLDQRLLGPHSRVGDVPWKWLEDWCPERPPGCDFIFHVSHAGSTLISRLVGEVPSVLALREPLLLRSIARGEHADRLGLLLRLWSRGFHPGQRPVIKATSHANAIAARLLDAVPDSRAVLLEVPVETFLAAVLDGAPGDVRGGAESRLRRLQAFGRATGQRVEELSIGEAAAMAWLCESLSLAELARDYPGRTKRFDFDRFLADVPAGVDRVLGHLRRPERVASIDWRTIVGCYAKQPGVPYDAATRARLLEQSRLQHHEEIDRGLAWLARHGESPR